MAATVRSPFTTTRDDIRVMTDTEVRAALAMLSGPGGGRAAGAGAAGEVRPALPPMPTVGYAACFIRGPPPRLKPERSASERPKSARGWTFSCSSCPPRRSRDSCFFRQHASESRTITMVGIGQTSIPGYMFDSFRTARPDAEGRFTFAGVTPGTLRDPFARRGARIQRWGLPPPTACVRHRRCGPWLVSPSKGRTSQG